MLESSRHVPPIDITAIRRHTDADRILRIEGKYTALLRLALILAGAISLWSWSAEWFGRSSSATTMGWVLGSYAFLTVAWWLVFSVLLPRRQTRLTQGSEGMRPWIVATFVIDQLYVTLVIYLTGGCYSIAYLLYALLAIKSAVYYPYLRDLTFVSFVSGILWVIACFTRENSLFFLADRVFLLRYGALFALICGMAFLGQRLDTRHQAMERLARNLRDTTRALEDQAKLVQGTANDLATRLVEMRSLQESVKAINSSLSINELLQLTVENATQVLRGARCTIALVDAHQERIVTAAAAGIERGELWNSSFAIGEGAAGWAVENRRPVLIHQVDEDPRFVRLGDWPVASLISVPLVSDGQVIGALTATSPLPHTFSDVDVHLLDAYADQAAIAVGNASLYAQLAQQEQQTAQLYEAMLEKSDELEAILKGIGDGVIVVDPDLRLLMMNPVATRVFHVHEMPTPDIRLPEIVDHEDLLSLANQALDGNAAPIVREITLESEGDRQLTYQALASLLLGAEGRPRGVVIAMRDITSQKEIDEVKSNFLSVVSHELRTPLHSIKGFVDIILMGKTGDINDLQRDFLQTVKESTTNLQRLIDDLLEFSRMEAGKVRLEPKPISVYDVGSRVVERLMPLAQQGKIALINGIPAEISMIEADPIRIEQVLTNLVSNAIKFTPEDKTVALLAEDIGDEIHVMVRDEGIGIPEDEQANVFQRFYQVDGSATRSYRGAGLGLTICKFIVEYHHGRIWVESEVGVGSIFHFVLPKELPEDEDLIIDFTTPAPKDTNR